MSNYTMIGLKRQKNPSVGRTTVSCKLTVQVNENQPMLTPSSISPDDILNALSVPGLPDEDGCDIRWNNHDLNAFRHGYVGS